MKKFCFVLLTFFSVILNADALKWEEKVFKDYWLQGNQCARRSNFKDALVFFNKAIELEKKVDHSLAIKVHNDRADTLLQLQKFEPALQDFSFVVDHPAADKKDVVFALYGKVYASSRLHKHEESKKDIQRIIQMDDTLPSSTWSEDHIVIKNVGVFTTMKNGQKRLAEVFINAGICKEEPDLIFSPSSDTCIVKRTGCRHCELREVSALGSYDACQKCMDRCEAVFDMMEYACTCIKWSHQYEVACIGAVKVLLDGCYWCCSTDGRFYERCVRPLVNFFFRCEDKTTTLSEESEEFEEDD